MELNVDNLIYMYEKARKEEVDIKEFFNIRSYNDAKFVLTPPVNRRVKKQELRIIYEELCYTSKLTYSEVNNYLNMLDGRVHEIENVIDSHFDLIKKSIY